MHQFQESIRPLEGIPAGRQSNWERRRQAWEHLESQYSSLGKTTSSLGTLLVHLEIIATTNRSTIFKTHVLSLYSHLCIYVSI